MPATIMVRYGEIALKGRNRGQFEQQLQHNLNSAVENYQAAVKKLHGRFIVSGPEEYLESMVERLSKVFGVVSVSPVWEAGLDLEEIKHLAVQIVGNLPPGRNKFKITTRRANKHFPHSSPEINRLLGSHLQDHFPKLIVSLKQPSFILSVEIGFDKAFLYLERIAGPGGLPVGITGRALLLLSGGIDSPVAGWLALKRGLALEAVHFHSFPFTSRRSQEKAVDLCRKLAISCDSILLHMISVTNIQKELRLQCPADLSIILLRRIMLRLSELLSERQNLQALVTGESLGQVASQTLESLKVTDAATGMLILRPLLSMDKKEIIDKALAVDTYEISIRPYEDCCTLFLPKNPVTKPKLAVVENFEARLDLENLLEEAMKSLETITVTR